MGTNGSLSFLFERKGVFKVKKNDWDPDEFQLEIIDAGVEECELEEDVFIITTAIEDFGNVQKKLEAKRKELLVVKGEIEEIKKELSNWRSNDLFCLEKMAREEFGMGRKGETLYLYNSGKSSKG